MNFVMLKRLSLIALISSLALNVFGTYKLVQVSTVSAGKKYVFVEDGYALCNSISNCKLESSNVYSTSGLTGSEKYVWELEGTKVANGYYMKAASINGDMCYLLNYKSTSETDMWFSSTGSVWQFTFSNNLAGIQNLSKNNRVLRQEYADSHYYKAYKEGASYIFKVYELQEMKNQTVLFYNTITEVNINSSVKNVATTNGGGVITYKSSDKNIATIDADGTVHGVSAGVVTITATASATVNYLDGSATYNIEVIDPTLYRFKITAESQSVLQDYTKTYSKVYSDVSSDFNVDAYGVYNNNGIQMKRNQGTYIKNTSPVPGYITKIVCVWKASGNNSPTIYMNKGSMASTSSALTAQGNNEKVIQTYTVTDPKASGYDYFYFDGITVSGVCVMTSMIVYYVPTNHTVKISSCGYTTMYLDYSTKIPDGAKAYYVSSYDRNQDQLIINQINDYVPANTGVLVAGTAGLSYTFTETSETVEAIETNLLKKAEYIEAHDFSVTDGWYYLSKSGSFAKYSGNAKMKANKAYLYLPVSERPWKSDDANTKGLSLVFIDATNLSATPDSSYPTIRSAYNLNGQKVDGSYRGIVVSGGRKYLYR